MTEVPRVLLLCMPFGLIERPALGISLLKARLAQLGIPCDVRYGTLEFARRFGWHDYKRISTGWPDTRTFLGEWMFTRALYGRRDEMDAEYRSTILAHAEAQLPHWFQPWDEAFIGRVEDGSNAAVEFVDHLHETTDWDRYDVVGFTTMFQQQISSLALARRIKASHPRVQIVFGGPSCEGVMGQELLRQFSCIDWIVSGEGEHAFVDALHNLSKHGAIGDVQGVFHRKRPRLPRHDDQEPSPARVIDDMDTLPQPDFSDYFEALGELFGSTMDDEVELVFETSRGCWWGERRHCTFCGLNGGSMTYRSKSPTRAYEELVALWRKHGIDRVQVVDNILDMRYFKDGFLPRLAEQQLPIRLFYEVKSNLRPEQVALMRRAGIDLIQPGIESLDSSVLARMAKGVKGVQNIQLLRTCAEEGIRVGWSIIFGFPGEDPEAYERLVDVVPQLSHLQPPGGIARVQLNRFAPLFSRSAELGVANARAVPAYEFLYPARGAALDRLAYLFDFDGDYERPVGEYTREFVAASLRWKEEHEQSALILVRRGGKPAVIDTRRIAVHPVTELTPAEHAMLKFCAVARPISTVREQMRAVLGLDAGDVDEVAARLRALGFLLQMDARWLTLVISRPKIRPAARRRLYQMMTGIGSLGHTATLPFSA